MRIRKLRKKVNKLREGGRTVGSGKVATIIIK
nr:MAG TPA: elongation factor Tu [Caudoviricetes sp.]